MKIAIHERKGSFSDRWIEYCQINSISYKIVNCYDNDILTQISDCNGLMWHWDLTDYKANLFAKQLTISLEEKGLKVFPSSNTSWHYDDKVGQKYLLESIGAPLVSTNVFYSKSEALEWIKNVKFPLVFKLRGGAGALNVSLINNLNHAKKMIKKAFGRGFRSRNRVEKIRSRIIGLRKTPSIDKLTALIKSILRVFILTDVEKYSAKQKGYIYFQNFIPDNSFDTRVTVIGNRAVSVRRYNRENDFRASGSNILSFDPEHADIKLIEIAFSVSKLLGSQSTGYDFVYDNGIPKIIEMSYAFPMGKVGNYHGYWDQNLKWHTEEVNLQFYMVEDFINEILKSEN